MKITIPELCVVALVGVSGSGKSTFAARHFLPTEVISSDFCRKLVSDDENDQSATEAAFQVLHTIAAKRLQSGRIAVIDATNVRPEDRKPIVQLAKDHHVFAFAIVLDVAPEVCHERNAARPDRDFGDHVIRNQRAALRRSINNLHREGFRKVFVLRGTEDIDRSSVLRERLWTDRRDLTGPFDIIGDVHGCHLELVELLERLGWHVAADSGGATHPDGRQAIFLGDLVDRGPASPAVLRLAMNMVGAGTALCIPGNHENKLKRALDGKNVTLSHGLAETMQQLAAEPEEFRTEVAAFIDGLVSHAVLDHGSLVVAHAGLPESMHGRSSGAVRSFALYGDTTGETDEFGLPVRYPWANDYRGRAAVVYGHTPVPEAVWVNGTICIDTGCLFGGSLTALRWPERELVSVRARATYYEPVRPILPVVDSRPADVLDLDDVMGKRIIEARLTGTVTVRGENAAAAIEVMSRFAIDPHWLIYLPPTMTPPATTSRAGLLEHPDEAFDAYRRDGVTRLVCEEKHMGSRAVVVVCRDDVVASLRFGVTTSASAGAIFTRTGRAFFNDPELESSMLDRVRAAIGSLDLWSELESDWLAFDCELLPWSAKAEELLRTQYASVGAAATAALEAERDIWAAVASRIADATPLADAAAGRLSMASSFVDAYRRYCWPTAGLDGLRLAPFQVLASEGRVRALDPHLWHMDLAQRLAAAAPDTFRATHHREVDLEDPTSEAAAVEWWAQLTGAGGEGMVVKPTDVIAPFKRSVAQPGIKCRGPEYLRIIYGPEYTSAAQLARLRERSLGHKRSLAVREFCLGIEALERFVRHEPLHRVHECVFGVLALESEPVDPRL
ncbi:MAG: polynucleotide kinase-phosphatase [Actinobacteria bacterium]|nr:polynucleotide kinase-phosphatase [Actinomycetota bacterium]